VSCRRCTECPVGPHHWIADYDELQGPIWTCKHCDFTMPYESEDPDADSRAFVVRGLEAWMRRKEAK